MSNEPTANQDGSTTLDPVIEEAAQAARLAGYKQRGDGPPRATWEELHPREQRWYRAMAAAATDSLRVRVVELEQQAYPARWVWIDGDGVVANVEAPACACGATLVGCPGCGGQRCATCDPFTAADIAAEHARLQGYVDALKGDLDDAMNRHDETCSILAERDAMRPAVEAAKELLRLKDGPRDAAYADQKPKAWAALRSALAPKWAGEGGNG